MQRTLDTTLFEIPAISFADHLQAGNNERILFSGKFGNGKSTFLLHFFEHQQKYLGAEKYDAYFIDPVNYAVASTDDIFRYIKYDILISLLSKNVHVESIELERFSYFKDYVKENYAEIIKRIIGYVPKVGKKLKEAATDIEALHTAFKKFQQKKQALTENHTITSFLKEIQSDQYSIYENDALTILIRHLLGRQQSTGEEGNAQQKTERKKVLVIDNLDRMDPEHIFRILNVFSVHLDYKTQEFSGNKFDFDHIILVCDIKNIRTIFHHKYGSRVDFQGYISKFYSKEIFSYLNYDSLDKYVSRMIENHELIYNRGTSGQLGTLISVTHLSPLISAFILNGHIGLRDVIHFVSSPLLIQDVFLNFDGIELKRSPWEIPVMEITYLAKLMGGSVSLLAAIDDLDNKRVSIPDLEKGFERLVIYLARDMHRFQRTDSRIPYPLHDEIIEFSVVVSNGKIFWKDPVINNRTHSFKFTPNEKQFYHLYRMAVNDMIAMHQIE